MSIIEELEAIEKADEEALAKIKLDAAKSTGPYTLKLTDPIMVGSLECNEITLRPMTIGDIRKSPTDDLVLTAALANISPPQTLEQLSPFDWRATQAVMAGFSLRRAAGGPARKA